MRNKILILLISITLLIGLSSCIKEMTYDDLLFAYEQDIAAREDIYQMYVDMYDQLSTTTIQSVVKVTKKVSLSSVTSVGSGFVFHEDLKSYYILTNHHVIYNSSTLSYTITVTDYLSTTHQATLLALDKHYDLAVLSIPKSNHQLQPLSFSETSLSFKDMIIVMGYPNGQVNGLALGELVDYDLISISNDEEPIGVDFDVLIMDVPVETGSSGSVILNEDYKIVGIIYAGNFLNNQEISEFAFGIPTLKIFEFFDLNNIPYQSEVTT